MFKCKAFFVSTLILKFDFNWIWILPFSCSYIKVPQWTQQDVCKIARNTLLNAPSCVKRSEKNLQAAAEESYSGEIEL